MVLKYSHGLEPVNVSLCRKKDFADRFKLRILRCGYYLAFSRWTQNTITKVLKREKQREILLQRQGCGGSREIFEDPLILALKMKGT